MVQVSCTTDFDKFSNINETQYPYVFVPCIFDNQSKFMLQLLQILLQQSTKVMSLFYIF